MKFHGTIEELKERISSIGLQFEWEQKPNQWQGRASSYTCIVNWWPTKGTVNVQGKDASRFSDQIEKAVTQTDVGVADFGQKVRIFVVHGHDTAARDQLELVLHRLGLNPFILQNQDGGTKTLIEALEQNIYKSSAFGIVLLTPDDFGYPKSKDDADRQPRARQNVVFEMGMLMASLGRERTAILKKGNLEMPSDAEGIIRIEFNDDVKEVVPKLVQRMQGAGIVLDQSKIAAAQG